MIKVVINRERCKSCGLCVAHCPRKNIIVSREINTAGYHPVVLCDEENCNGCGICAMMCPDVCIEIYRSRKAGVCSE